MKMYAEYKKEVESAIDSFIEGFEDFPEGKRYKAMRALAYKAFTQCIDNGSIDDLVEGALKDVKELPSGWTIHSNRKFKSAAKAEDKAEAQENSKLDALVQ